MIHTKSPVQNNVFGQTAGTNPRPSATARSEVPAYSPGRPLNWLVAWFDFPVGGGIGRFINLARTLAPFGCNIRFLSLSNEVKTSWPDFPGTILSWEVAQSQNWDAVMVPGAGAVDEKLEQLVVLQDPKFGTRVQHILNDPSMYPKFEKVNEFLDPHLVVINNTHWQLKDLKKLHAEGFHFLPGAIATNCFFPQPFKTIPQTPPNWKIGGYATKNPGPLFETIQLLPENFSLHLYGRLLPEDEPIAEALMRAGRLFHYDQLYGASLASFYQQMDLVVTTEERAGWCNTAAEASACGTPCIVASAGTLSFAEHLNTALVLEETSGPAIADDVLRLASDPTLMKGIATRAATRTRSYSWENYAAQLLAIVQNPRVNSYYRLPEFNLWGKWDPALRFSGVFPIFEQGPNATVLDLGAAEGIAAYLFSDYAIDLYHGFEYETSRVELARQLLANTGIREYKFKQADLSDWVDFTTQNQHVLLDEYDVVLFLGLYHHLPEGRRKEVLTNALKLTKEWFAIRTPENLAKKDHLLDLITASGFTPVAQQGAVPEENMGWLGLFRRSSSG